MIQFPAKPQAEGNMRILAIETVETTGSVALLEDECLVAERPLDPQGRSAQTLAPGIEQLLAEARWRAGDVELVAVATGPGSFTGLRIGVTTAKVFAYAAGCQVIGVSTMSAIASRVPQHVTYFSVILDAHRNELFVADERLEELESSIRRPLTGLKVVPYYGCLSVRPPTSRCRPARTSSTPAAASSCRASSTTICTPSGQTAR